MDNNTTTTTTTTGTVPTTPTVTAVPVMSADLISYRFDQHDKNLADFKHEAKEELNNISNKLDKMTTVFETKVDAAKAHQDIWDAFANFTRNVKWWVTTLIGFVVAVATIYSIVKVH